MTHQEEKFRTAPKSSRIAPSFKLCPVTCNAAVELDPVNQSIRASHDTSAHYLCDAVNLC